MWRVFVGVILLLAPLSVGAQGRIPSRFFTQSSTWYQKIPTNAVVHPNSAAIIQNIEDHSASLGVIYQHFSVPIFYAAGTDPLVTVSTASEAPNVLGWTTLRIPDAARPSGYGQEGYHDGHMTIIDPDRLTATDFYQAVRTDATTWSAGRMRKWDLTKNGMNSPYDFLTGARLCPCPLLQGIPTYEEVVGGTINHALIVALNTQQGTYFAPYPCEASVDGNNANPNPPQAGMRLQLDPSVNIQTLGLNSTGLIIAQALQEYGMVIVDQAGSSDFDLYLEELTFRGDGASWSTPGLPNLGVIPTSSFRVVESPQVADPSAVLVRTTQSADYYWRPFNNGAYLRDTVPSGTVGTRLHEPVTIDTVPWWFVDLHPTSGNEYGWIRADELEIITCQ